jgi:hypothetical protein
VRRHEGGNYAAARVFHLVRAFALGKQCERIGEPFEAYRGASVSWAGGPDNKIFLGCLNCSEYDANSVHNEFGVYGSRYSATSIVNRFGEYGSRASGYSVCNASTLQAPVIVDEQGTFYGRLTVNPAATDRLRDEATRAWLAGVCEAT